MTCIQDKSPFKVFDGIASELYSSFYFESHLNRAVRKFLTIRQHSSRMRTAHLPAVYHCIPWLWGWWLPTPGHTRLPPDMLFNHPPRYTPPHPGPTYPPTPWADRHLWKTLPSRNSVAGGNKSGSDQNTFQRSFFQWKQYLLSDHGNLEKTAKSFTGSCYILRLHNEVRLINAQEVLCYHVAQ